jgi:hypothetical protein
MPYIPFKVLDVVSLLLPLHGQQVRLIGERLHHPVLPLHVDVHLLYPVDPFSVRHAQLPVRCQVGERSNAVPAHYSPPV